MSEVRVLALAPTFPPVLGGLELLAQRVVSNMPGVRTRVLALEPPAGSPSYSDGDLDVRRLRGRRVGDRRSLARYNAWVLAEALRFRPGAILSFHVSGSLGGVFASAVLRRPLVQYTHAKEFGGFERLTRLAVRRAAVTVAVSSYTVGLAVEAGARPDRIRRILNGVDLPSDPRVERAGPPTIVTVSRLDDRYKGHDTVLDALPRIIERVPSVRWRVIGAGALESELRERASAMGLRDVVSFEGRVSDVQRDAILAQSHVFVMPSRIPSGGAGGEGFGIALLEANAHGVPVVAGRAGGVVDAVIDGETALLVDPSDAGAVADAVIHLLSDEDRRRAFGRAAIRHAQGFSWAAVGLDVEGLIRSVCP